jgi:hypothetical protein
MLKCPKCGYDNELGRIFCHSCGSKLDLDQIRAASRAEPKSVRRPNPKIGFVLWRAFQVVVLLSIVLILYLAAQVPGIRAISTTSDDLKAANHKWIELGRSIDLREPATLEITEAELNAFVSTLGFKDDETRTFGIRPVNLQIELGDGVIRLLVLGELQFGTLFKKKVQMSCTGTATMEQRRLIFTPVDARIGALPIHPVIVRRIPFFRNQFVESFQNLVEENKILNQMASVTVRDQRVLLVYQPPPRPTQ